jgi:hypothetical protein
MGTIKSENCNFATMERDNRRRLVLLRTLKTRDFDELAEAFPQWDLRFRQLGPVGCYGVAGDLMELGQRGDRLMTARGCQAGR